LLDKCAFPVKSIEILSYENKETTDKFQASYQKGDQFMYLFHSSGPTDSTQPHHPLMISGFSNKLVGANHLGFFGKGFYLTSFLEYALFYQLNVCELGSLEQKIIHKNKSFKILLFLVNLGKCQNLLKMKEIHILI
jgi:hypothetical protein